MAERVLVSPSLGILDTAGPSIQCGISVSYESSAHHKMKAEPGIT